MNTPSPVQAAERSGLIWGFDFAHGSAQPLFVIAPPEAGSEGLRWLHLNLADVRVQRWIGACAALPAPVRDGLLDPHARPHGVLDGEVALLVLPDIERDFDEGEPRLGLMRMALAPGLVITARTHPLRSADVMRERIQGGATPESPAASLELLLAAMSETVRRVVGDAEVTVQRIEDQLLDSGRTPDARAFVTLRGLMVRTHRLLTGARAVLRDLSEDHALPPDYETVVDKAARRLAGLDGELLTVQSQLRLLREEIDLQATQRTNQNLYILSILSALMLPATLVTGYFGMNTGGLPWQQHPIGTTFATIAAIAASAAVYIGLRLAGFMRR
ncbi:MAG: CorA family divalent cation transporter [Caulobacteraceae bacterium]